VSETLIHGLTSGTIGWCKASIAVSLKLLILPILNERTDNPSLSATT
jgi:hypothetical protein